MRKLLKDEFPEIFKEIDLDKTNVDINSLTFRSNQIIYWKCSNNHSYKQMISARTRDHGCPYCANKKVLKGYNDLLTLFPDLCKEWDYEKNNVMPNEIMSKTARKVYWKCSNNHSYQMRVFHRTSGEDCPYCKNKKILKGFNDLQTLYPDIVKEWDYEKNFNEYGLKPDEVTYGSNKRVYWKCNNGHSWQTTIKHKIGTNCSCPICNYKKQISKGEQLIFDELQKLYICEQRKKHKINGKLWETDIFIPTLNLGIEFNGLYWHRNKIGKDKIKESVLSTKIKMLYIMEGMENKIVDNKIYFDSRRKYDINLDWAKNKLLKIISIF